MEDDNHLLLIPKPVFLQAADFFTTSITKDDKRGPSFLDRCQRLSGLTIMPTDKRGRAVSEMHIRLRGLGGHYGELLQGPDTILTSNSQKSLEECFKENTLNQDTITLHFGKRKKSNGRSIIDNHQHVTISNIDCNGLNLAQLLFLLGKAGEEMASRPDDDMALLKNYLGLGKNIVENMGYAYEVLYSALREKGFNEGQAIGMIRDSGLDIDEDVFQRLKKDMGADVPRPQLGIRRR